MKRATLLMLAAVLLVGCGSAPNAPEDSTYLIITVREYVAVTDSFTPVSGVEIYFAMPAGSDKPAGITDEHGRFILERPFAEEFTTAQLFLVKKGYRIFTESVYLITAYSEESPQAFFFNLERE